MFLHVGDSIRAKKRTPNANTSHPAQRQHNIPKPSTGSHIKTKQGSSMMNTMETVLKQETEEDVEKPPPPESLKKAKEHSHSSTLDNFLEDAWKEEEDRIYRYAFVAFLVVLLTIILVPVLVPFLAQVPNYNLEEQSQFANQYSLANAIFSGLAFIGVFLALSLQRLDLRMQREQFAKQMIVQKQEQEAANERFREEIQQREREQDARQTQFIKQIKMQKEDQEATAQHFQEEMQQREKEQDAREKQFKEAMEEQRDIARRAAEHEDFRRFCERDTRGRRLR